MRIEISINLVCIILIEIVYCFADKTKIILAHNANLLYIVFLGDIVIGAYVTELINNDKDLLLRAFCILPYFRNFGFGMLCISNLLLIIY